MEPLTVNATLESLKTIADYVLEAAAVAGLDRKASYGLHLAVDEIGTNIIMYGYVEAHHEGVLDVRAEIGDATISITIEDDGIAYDPSQSQSPNIDLPPEEREFGGLGLLLAMQSVDKFIYERVDGRNRNTFIVNRTSAPSEE